LLFVVVVIGVVVVAGALVLGDVPHDLTGIHLV